jgi:hypothetical protein
VTSACAASSTWAAGLAHLLCRLLRSGEWSLHLLNPGLLLVDPATQLIGALAVAIPALLDPPDRAPPLWPLPRGLHAHDR